MKKCIAMILVLSVVFSCLTGISINAEQPSIYLFEPGYEKKTQTYSGMDVTGDNVLDSVKLTYAWKGESDQTGTCKVYVNNKQVFSQTREMDPVWTVKILRLENGKAFFDISSTIVSSDCGIHCLYEYSEDKLKKVYDFQKYYEKYAHYFFVESEKIEGNAIYTEVYAMYNLTGVIYYDVKLDYKDGKFKMSANQFKINYNTEYGMKKNNWTVSRKIKAYKKVGSKKVAFTLKKGDKVKLDKVIYKKNKPYIQIRRKGKSKKAYLSCDVKSSYPQYFKEAMFAG